MKGLKGKITVKVERKNWDASENLKAMYLETLKIWKIYLKIWLQGTFIFNKWIHLELKETNPISTHTNTRYLEMYRQYSKKSWL